MLKVNKKKKELAKREWTGMQEVKAYSIREGGRDLRKRNSKP